MRPPRLNRPRWLPRSPPVLVPPPRRGSSPRSRAEMSREAIRLIGRYRRWLSAGFVGIAVAITVSVFAPQPASGEVVVTAARDLAAGATLTTKDLRSVRFTATQLPAGALTQTSQVIGRRLGGAVRRGEPLTDVRLDDAGMLASPGAGLVATPIRLADTQAADLLQPGMRIDVLAASTQLSVGAAFGGGSAAGSAVEGDPASGITSAIVIADSVTVIAVPAATLGTANSTDPLDQDGALVVLATTPAQARLLAQAQVSDRLSAVAVP